MTTMSVEVVSMFAGDTNHNARFDDGVYRLRLLAVITFRQARCYLPNRKASRCLDQYHIILLGDRGIEV